MIIEHESNPSWAVARTPGTATPHRGPVDEIEVLLRRYPLLSPSETQRCVTFLAGAPIAERGALSSRPGMAAKMDQLRRDHPKPFRPSMAVYIVTALLIVATLVSGLMAVA